MSRDLIVALFWFAVVMTSFNSLMMLIDGHNIRVLQDKVEQLERLVER